MENQEIAQNLLKKAAVKLSLDPPFKWASGIFSPIYCDNRLMVSYPAERKVIVDKFVQLIKEKGYEFDLLAAEGGAIPWASFVAYEMGVPMIYIRKEAKKHGRMNKIEGNLQPGQKVLLIEDLVSTGGSAIRAVESVREGDGNVVGVVAIFTYELNAAEQNLKEANLEIPTLTNFTTLLEEAKKMDYIGEDMVEKIKLFTEDPKVWGDKMGYEV